jgi:hypothetical protein
MQGNAFAGVTSVTFSKVKVLNVVHAGSAVEVTLQYGGVRKNIAGMVDPGNAPGVPVKSPPPKPGGASMGWIKSVVRLQ